MAIWGYPDALREAGAASVLNRARASSMLMLLILLKFM